MSSRRAFIGGLAALVAAPAIVRVESLMKLAKTEVLRPDVSLQLITNYDLLDDVKIHCLDVLYSKLHVRPEWQVFVPQEIPAELTLDSYAERILAPMVNKLAEQVADSVMHGSDSFQYGLSGVKGGLAVKPIPLSGLLLGARRATISGG